ncbi:cupin domain-containing protein [Pseudomonas putida]|uniref:cupin domain-containing protein n=1 Tax=Pseudomonas putida TaxID=303 RepID=UPI00384AE0C4
MIPATWLSACITTSEQACCRARYRRPAKALQFLFYENHAQFNTAFHFAYTMKAQNNKIGPQAMTEISRCVTPDRSTPSIVLKSAITAALISLTLLSSVKASEALAPKAKVVVNSTTSWEGVKYAPYPSGQPKLSLLKITIPPHTALPWHHHPVANIAYVISGQLTIEDRLSKKTLVVKAGEAFPESVGSSHRGVTGDEEAVVIVAYAGVEGTPLSVPDKNEKPEFEHME